MAYSAGLGLYHTMGLCGAQVSELCTFFPVRSRLEKSTEEACSHRQCGSVVSI